MKYLGSCGIREQVSSEMRVRVTVEGKGKSES